MLRFGVTKVIEEKFILKNLSIKFWDVNVDNIVI